VEGLSLRGPDGTPILTEIDMEVGPGRIRAVLGPSGAGKSSLVKAIMGTLPPSLKIVQGRIWLAVPPGKEAALLEVPPEAVEETAQGRRVDLLALTPGERRAFQGYVIAGVPQLQPWPLDPLRSARNMVADAVQAHHFEATRNSALGRADAALARVGLQPHRANAPSATLSGGEGQRVLLALGLVNSPSLFVFDEPTSALDCRARCLLLNEISGLLGPGTGALLITHDLGAVRKAAQEVSMLWEGRVVEEGDTDQVLTAPTSPLTKRLLGAELSIDAPYRPSL
jgi:ABC-type glutathione transport system ATPase component